MGTTRPSLRAACSVRNLYSRLLPLLGLVASALARRDSQIFLALKGACSSLRPSHASFFQAPVHQRNCRAVSDGSMLGSPTLLGPHSCVFAWLLPLRTCMIQELWKFYGWRRSQDFRTLWGSVPEFSMRSFCRPVHCRICRIVPDEGSLGLGLHIGAPLEPRDLQDW